MLQYFCADRVAPENRYPDGFRTIFYQGHERVNAMKEIWKDVAGYEGLYQVSNLGKVKSLNYNHTGKPKIMSFKHGTTDYLFVSLSKHKRVKNKYIHVMVAEAFVPNKNGLPCVNHIDGDKTNNRVENLEWVTYSQNTRHAIKIGLRTDSNMRGVKGVANKNSRPVWQYTKDGELLKIWPCVSDAARYYNCSPCTIVNCYMGRIKSCVGYIWKSAETN